MSLNTNFSNSSNRSAVSFQAALRTEIPVKDLERLANIKKLFGKATEHYKSDTLTYTMSKDPAFAEYPVVTTTPNRISCGEYRYSHLIDNFDELMQKMSDNQIVKKLVNYFKTMKKEEQFDNFMDGINKEIGNVKNSKDKNLLTAKLSARRGNNKTAAQFRTLAENNQKRIDSLEAQKLKEGNRILQDIEKSVKNEPDLAHVPDAIRDAEQLPLI